MTTTPKLIDQALLAQLTNEAVGSARLRKNYNFHPRLDDPVQRLCNAMEPDTYVRPHRHPQEDRWELFLTIVGQALVLTFDDRGKITDRIELCSTGPVYGIELPTNTWHTVCSLKTGTVLFEVKKGPYQPLTDKDFANWAPKEGDPDCARFVAWYKHAIIGAIPPAR
ncbi:MAG: WbuC family cupin fold metalloprotein [Gammaproteobacteria bacterium]|nr:WbuC family cupin fold metalloprotein [Gammaproteobacteria bacterium]